VSGESLPLVLVLAVADNGVIGRGQALPWDLPDDLQHFKRVTFGRPILMGRKTFESVGRPLPGRTNFVITRDKSWTAAGVRVVHSLDEAIDAATDQALLDGADALMVIGGAEIYRLALPRASRVVITEVHGTVDGDAWFDRESLSDWREVSRQRFPAGERNSHDFSVVELVAP
jgi:dihydrofolate reductase